jgi:hypothetical protein
MAFSEVQQERIVLVLHDAVLKQTFPLELHGSLLEDVWLGDNHAATSIFGSELKPL